MSRLFVDTNPQVVASAPAQITQGATGARILEANARRRGLLIQNTGTTVIKLVFGNTNPTATAYHVALAPASGADDGTGGLYTDDAWQGPIRAISSGAGGTLVITEFLEES